MQGQPGLRQFRTIKSTAGIALLCSGLLLSGCDRQEPPAEPAPAPVTASLNSPEAVAITEQVWQNQNHDFSEVLSQTRALKQAVDTLTQQPTMEHLQTVREQWHIAHNALLSQAPLFALGTINPGLFQQIQQSHSLIDAQPIQPGYLDYFAVYQHTGIVNDIAARLTAEDLRQQHRFSDDSDVSLGFHAMAYLLWGEDQQRPLEDFQVPEAPTQIQRDNGLKLVDLPSHRRGTLLQLQATLLLDDLSALHYKLSHQASGLTVAYQSISSASRMQLWLRSCRSILERLQRQTAQQPEPGQDEFFDHNRFSGQHTKAMAAILRGMARLLFTPHGEVAPLGQQLLGDAQAKALGDNLQQLQQALSSEETRPLNEREDIQALLQQSLDLLGDRPHTTAN